MPVEAISHGTTTRLFLPVLLFSLVFFTCGKDPSSVQDPDEPSYRVPENVFFKQVNPDNLATVGSNATSPFKVAADQLVVLADPEMVAEENADTLASDLGGTLVGKIPYFGIYQYEFGTTTLAELNMKRNDLLQTSAIREVSYNRLPRYRSAPSYCDRKNDNFKLSWSRRAAFEHIFYPTLEPLMAKVGENISLSKVVVGLFDSGLNPSTGQFDNLRTINMISPGTPLTEFDTSAHGHGTMVAGFIGADSRDGVTNGIASAVLDDKLEMAVAYDTLSTAGLVYYVYLGTFVFGVDVFNMSFGYGGANADSTLPATRRLLKAVFQSLPQSLFVVAADNDPFVLDTTNDAPAGIQLDNVITVGGTKHDTPDSAYQYSSRGPLIDIAAPADQVTCVHPSMAGQKDIDEGNSFATPMVTAAAAILKSVSPGLTPAKIKTYLLDNSYPTTTQVGGRRLILPLPLEQLLIEMPAPKTILDLVDIDSDPGSPDNPGLVKHRICGGSHVSIKGYGTRTYSGDTAQVGNVNAYGFTMFCVTDESSLGIGLHDYACIGESFPFVKQSTEERSSTATLAFVDTIITGGGTAASGSITVVRCEILERDPLEERPMILQLEATYSGVMEWIDEGGTPVTKEFDGALSLPVVYGAWGESVTEYLERNCVGGREYENAS